MVFPTVKVSWKLIFNNTGFDWVALQKHIVDTVEKDYKVLHCINDKFLEERNIGAKYIEVNGVECILYFRVKDLTIEVVALKADNRKPKDDEENE